MIFTLARRRSAAGPTRRAKAVPLVCLPHVALLMEQKAAAWGAEDEI